MASKPGKRKLFNFSLEFRTFKQSGRFSPSFFEQLESLAGFALKKHRVKPELFDIVAEDWNPEAVHELAMEFLTQHLISKTENRLNHILDAVQDSEVDHLMMLIFDQFVVEAIRRRFPHRSNLRNRIRRGMQGLMESGKAVNIQGVKDMWAPPKASRSLPLELKELQDQVGELPHHASKKYHGWQRISPELSERDLQGILSAIFSCISAPVRLQTLTEFLCLRLGIWDAAFDSIEGIQDEADQEGSALPISIQHALSLEGEADAVPRLSRILERLSRRQMKIFEMCYREGKDIDEITRATGWGKTTVYDELKNIREIMEEELGE